jgi:hypothetical protein
MSELCEHETFKDICGTCHRDAQITRLRAEVRVRQTIVEEARDERDAALADNKRLRAALKQIAGIYPWDDGEQGYVDKARAALEEK